MGLKCCEPLSGSPISRLTQSSAANSLSNCGGDQSPPHSPAAGLWGGLWSPPQFESEFAALDWVRREIGEPERGSQHLSPIHHAFTHFDLRLNPLRVRCRPNPAIHDGDDRLWYALKDPPRVGLPQPILKLFERLRNAQGG